MRFQPLGDRVLVQIADERQSASGLIIPDIAKERQSRGTVVAIGDGHWDSEANRYTPIQTVQPGDEIVFSKYGGVEIEFDGEELLVLRESDILGKITDE